MIRQRAALLSFGASVAFLALVYGHLSSAYGWFPDAFLSRAREQAEALIAWPEFLVPIVYERSGVRVVSPDRMEPGLTLVASVWGDLDWTAGLKLMDRRGRVLHTWRVDGEEVFDGIPAERDVRFPYIHGTYLFPDGDVLVNLDLVGTVRLDACGRVLWSRADGGHHSIARADDGTFWIPTIHLDARPSSDAFPDGYPGLDGPVYHDGIHRITEDGEVLDEISVFEVLYANGLERYLRKAPWVDLDPTHLNDVEPLPAAMAAEYPLFSAGDLLLSLRNLHMVLVLDPSTGRVKWHARDPFILQHDPDFLGDGWIGVFDNNRDRTRRGAMLGGTRIVAVRPHTGEREVLFPGPASDPFYTEFMGKWQRLEGGNLLLTEAKAGRAVEVGPRGGTVWEWINEPYNEFQVPEVTEATRYPLSAEDVSTWRCAVSPP
ncbi:MAG: arylsulfotransferase family protein [Gemmatimonadota bacterium]|jgi:hypothetical protein